MASRLSLTPTPIGGVTVLERSTAEDERGDFGRLFCAAEFGDRHFGGSGVAQSNISRNVASGTVRGLHLLLPPAEEYKIVTCVQGAIWDIALDLRPGSSTLHAWFAVELRAEENRSLVVPPGVAHGFQTLEDNSTVLYLHSQPYRPELDAGLRADDPKLGITWPRPITMRSHRDAGLPTADELLVRMQ